MTRSANEVSALAHKAALGAGFPDAQAYSFGQAAAQHLAQNGAALSLEQALGDATDSPILRLPLLMDDVLRLLMLSRDTPIELTLQPGDEALAPSYARTLPLAVSDCRIVTGSDGQTRLRIIASPGTAAPHALPARIDMPQDLIDWLTKLAARTYVPSSAASRLRGAGAGLNDND